MPKRNGDYMYTVLLLYPGYVPAHQQEPLTYTAYVWASCSKHARAVARMEAMMGQPPAERTTVTDWRVLFVGAGHCQNLLLSPSRNGGK